MNCKNYPEFSDHHPEKNAGSREINKKINSSVIPLQNSNKEFWEAFCKGHLEKLVRKYQDNTEISKKQMINTGKK